MSGNVAFPFLTLSQHAVRTQPWQVSLSGCEWQELGDFIPEWDASTPLCARRQLEIDTATVVNDLQLDSRDIRLALVATSGTGRGRLPRVVLTRKTVLVPQPNGQVELLLELDSSQLAHALHLRVDIMLAASPGSPRPLSPRRGGDRVWSDTWRARIEGDEPRFPMEVADFRSLGDGANAAPWMLHWRSGAWRADFHGAIRLLLNSQHTDFLARMQEQDPLTLQTVLGDVMSQLCERLVSEPEAAELIRDSDSATIAGQASSWLSKAFPGQSVSAMRDMLILRPGRFRAALLALAQTEG